MSFSKFDDELKIWFGPEENFAHEEIDFGKSIGEHIYERMRSHSDRVCQITDPDGITLTHGDVLKHGINVALFLRKLKLTKKDVVGIIAENSTMMLPIAVGCWLNSTPFFAIQQQSEKKTISLFFGYTRPKVVFADAAIYKTLGEACKFIRLAPKIFIVNGSVTGVYNLNELLQPNVEVDKFQPQKLEDGPDQTSLYLCSAGTTGTSKCMHLSNSQILAEYRAVSQNCTILTFSNLCWMAGIKSALTVLLSSCKHVVTSEAADPQLAIALIQKYRINHFLSDASLLIQIIKCHDDKPKQLTSLQTIETGGSTMPTPIIQQTRELLSDGALLCRYYGTTECGTIASNVSFENPKSVGKLLPGVRVKIINEVGRSLGPDEIGEILVKNGRLWRGYVANAKKTAASHDIDGWFRTGDLGYFDTEANLYIVGRKCDVLKFRGRSYMPSEIEQAIAAQPDVIEVCAFGVHHDIDMDRAAAAVTLKRNSCLTEVEIEKFVAAKLPNHMHLYGGAYIVKDFPRTGNGKILRRVLRERFIKVNKDKKGLEAKRVHNTSKL